MRGIFAYAVLWWHVAGYKSEIPSIFNVPGRVSVWMFFGISGYVIACGFFDRHHTFTMQGIKRYAIRRFARIFPLFWLLTLIVIGLLISPTGMSGVSLVQWVQNLFALKWVHTGYPVGVFWTLGVELQFYTIAPLICFLVMQTRYWAVWLIVAIGVLIAAVTINGLTGGMIDNRTLLGSLNHFLVGILIAKACRSERLAYWLGRPWLEKTSLIVGVLLLFVSNILYHHVAFMFWYGFGAAITNGAICGLLLFHVKVEQRRVPAGLLTRVLMIFGVLAYGVYAWHGFLLEYFTIFKNQLVLTTLATLVCATLTYLLIEKPAILWSKRIK